MAIAALVPITLAYGSHGLEVTTVPARFNWVMVYLFQSGSGAHQTLLSLIQHAHLPAAWWNFAEGVMALKAHNDTGHLSFLLGDAKLGGWWYFYLVALAVNTAAAAAVGCRRPVSARPGWFPGRQAPGGWRRSCCL